MAHYEEKLYRVTKTQPPALSDLRSQLATLKRDLEHFQSSRASAVLMASVKERIRQIETHLAREAQTKPRPIAVPEDNDTPAAVYATQARYGARARRAPQ
ncbi:MAG: hypothetical protein H7Z12_13545 [Rhodospirillaceae bacterium]|nr:hypothetical protein [Rhodospirillales bacterium]